MGRWSAWISSSTRSGTTLSECHRNDAGTFLVLSFRSASDIDVCTPVYGWCIDHGGSETLFSWSHQGDCVRKGVRTRIGRGKLIVAWKESGAVGTAKPNVAVENGVPCSIIYCGNCDRETCTCGYSGRSRDLKTRHGGGAAERHQCRQHCTQQPERWQLV